MKQVNRLAQGGRIDRSRPIKFKFNNKELEGFAGDTLASALLANGVNIVNRSFKYSRARGIVGAGAERACHPAGAVPGVGCPQHQRLAGSGAGPDERGR